MGTAGSTMRTDGTTPAGSPPNSAANTVSRGFTVRRPSQRGGPTALPEARRSTIWSKVTATSAFMRSSEQRDVMQLSLINDHPLLNAERHFTSDYEPTPERLVLRRGTPIVLTLQVEGVPVSTRTRFSAKLRRDRHTVLAEPLRARPDTNTADASDGLWGTWTESIRGGKVGTLQTQWVLLQPAISERNGILGTACAEW